MLLLGPHNLASSGLLVMRMTSSERRTGADMRERLLDLAEDAVLAKGFGATSVEELAAEAGITKNGFFYHFPNKNALALALLHRYVERDDALFDDVLARGRELSDDPLEAFLIALKLLAEATADLPEKFPGCLVATFCYQERLFDLEVHALYHKIVLDWRSRFRSCLEAICEHYDPREDIDLDSVADMISTAIEGGMVLGRATGDSKILPAQIEMVRICIRMLFR
ncbi:putative HTH-type transcriptional regulator YxaF [Nitratireductor thuwali]|uniref:HTH-type transcriptional regulator YxaF n=2 Tax=Nitratireductor thuwali TaxID=2267699 RepID=A0ABY5MNJ6_9HYPH|nr:putative HTH-type transcriptional regulator YxaF [Nitratireductor thuwali]